MRKTKKALVAFLLAVVMMVPMFAINAFAATNKKYDYNGDGKVVYTSLGDSIAGGFGLKDYNKYGQTLIYGHVIQGAYPTLLASKLGANQFNAFAISGLGGSKTVPEYLRWHFECRRPAAPSAEIHRSY